MRLIADGGWPWEKVKTELKVYDLLFPGAVPFRQLLKTLSLLPALAIPPRLHYCFWKRVAQSDLYGLLWRRWLPFPEAPHLQKRWWTGR